MKSFLRLAFISLVLLVVAMASALLAMRFAIHGSEVAVPGVTGIAPGDAERAIAGVGLTLAIERQYYSVDVPEGKIISQMPVAGTKVRRGWQVRVAQSLGPQRVAIPDVLGESGRAADLNIRRRGLDIGGLPANAWHECRSGTCAESAAECEWSFGPAFESSRDQSVADSRIRHAEFHWANAGHGKPCGIGRRLPCGQRDGRTDSVR
jgi:PASTA domain